MGSSLERFRITATPSGVGSSAIATTPSVSPSHPGRGDGSALTYLQAREAFTPGQWVHVVGTYDGNSASTSTAPSPPAMPPSPVPSATPDHASLVLGAYRDDDEHYPAHRRHP